jgi:hypothetical protein
MKNRKKRIADIVNRIFYIQGLDCDGNETERWCIMGKELYNTIGLQEKKLDKTINIQPKLGDLVVHRRHEIGLGLIVERHPERKAYRVSWVSQPQLNLFIMEEYLMPVT